MAGIQSITTQRDKIVVARDLDGALDRCSGIVEVCRVAVSSRIDGATVLGEPANPADVAASLAAASNELHRIRSLVDELQR